MHPELTIFTCPKPFTGEFERIQSNALRSWHSIVGKNIYLVNAEQDTFRWAMEFDTGLIQQFKRNEYGTPLMDEMFRVAENLCETDLIAFVNTDILLFPEFKQVVEICARELPHFLMVGQRTDVNFADVPMFNRLSKAAIYEYSKTFGTRIGVGASDYFVWRKGDLGNIPPFALGRFRWDNWLMWRAGNRGLALVDATEAVLAVHQNHPPIPRVEGDAERVYNDGLVSTDGGNLGRLTDATHYLAADFELRERMKA